MEQEKFTGNFRFFDYSLSHKRLLLRKNDSYGFSGPNTDLIFEGVFYIDMPTSLSDFTIYLSANEVVKSIEEKIGERIHQQLGIKVYTIESGKRLFYIGCARFMVEENNLPFSKSSLY